MENSSMRKPTPYLTRHWCVTIYTNGGHQFTGTYEDDSGHIVPKDVARVIHEQAEVYLYPQDNRTILIKNENIKAVEVHG